MELESLFKFRFRGWSTSENTCVPSFFCMKESRKKKEPFFLKLHYIVSQFFCALELERAYWFNPLREEHSFKADLDNTLKIKTQYSKINK